MYFGERSGGHRSHRPRRTTWLAGSVLEGVRVHTCGGTVVVRGCARLHLDVALVQRVARALVADCASSALAQLSSIRPRKET